MWEYSKKHKVIIVYESILINSFNKKFEKVIQIEWLLTQNEWLLNQLISVPWFFLYIFKLFVALQL